MSEQYGDLFDDEGADAGIPPRSYLYNLPLAGGEIEGDHESLLSYLHRLAQRHQVRIKDLLVRVVLPETCIRGVPCSYRFTSEYARTINGYGKYATEFHAALSGLTKVLSLERSNFLTWRLLFDGKGAGLLHPSRRWCPCCIADGTGYSSDGHAHPLLWACAVVTHCPVHGCPLADACMKCSAPQAQISDTFSSGHCGACGSSLGWRAGLLEGTQLSERQVFVTKAVRQMIAANTRAAEIAKPENFAAGIRNVAKQTHHGVVRNLARSIHLDHKVLSKWVWMEMRPRFDSFIELCYRLGAMPLDLLVSTTQALEPQLRPGSQPMRRSFHKLTDVQLQQAKAAIAQIVEGQTQFKSAKQFAADFGTSVGHLQYRLPLEYRALVEHRRRLQAAESQRRAADKVETARAVARELAQDGKQVPMRKLEIALREKGCSMLCPRVRDAAKAELKRLRSEHLPGCR